MASSTGAIENNNKLFPIVASKLNQRDPATYISVVEKFGQWLIDEKAYYPAARPEIIKILGIAYMNLRRAVGVDINSKAPFNLAAYLPHPMIGPYSQLLRTVYPHRHLFIEKDLQEQLQSLLSMIKTSSSPSVTPPKSSPIALPEPRPALLARHGHIATMQPSSSSLATALEMRPSFVSTNTVIGLSSAMTSPLGEAPTAVAQEKLAASSHILPINASGSTQLPIKPKKKRKRPLPSSILAKDIEELNRKRYMQQESQITIKEEPIETPQILNLSIPKIIADSPKGLQEAGLPTVAYPVDDLATVDRQFEPLPSGEVFPHTAQKSPNPSGQSVPQLLPDDTEPDKSQTLATATQSVITTLEQAGISPVQPLTPLIGDETVQMAQFTESEVEPEIDQQSQGITTEVEPQDNQPVHSPISQAVDLVLVGPQSLNDNPFPSGPAQVPVSPTTVSLGPTENIIGGFVGDVLHASTTPRTGPVSIVSSPLDFKATDSGETSETAVQYPTILPAFPTSENREPEAQINMDAFGGEMRILAFQRGLHNRSKVTIRFEIPPEQYDAIQLWNNRKKAASIIDLRQSLCLSLGCYLNDTIKDKGNLADLTALPSRWPQAGELSMDILYNGQHNHISLSPPFQADPNGLVDVSKFLLSGSNIIELSQRADMRGYVFILRAHYPTRSQLEEVVQRHKKNLDWQDWLQHICRPLDVSIPVFS